MVYLFITFSSELASPFDRRSCSSLRALLYGGRLAYIYEALWNLPSPFYLMTVPILQELVTATILSNGFANSSNLLLFFPYTRISGSSNITHYSVDEPFPAWSCGWFDIQICFF